MDYKMILKKVGAVLLALTFWQLAAMLIKQNILLVTPIAVLKRMLTIWQEQHFLGTIWFTFYHIVGGFLLGLLVGVICAILAYKVKTIEILLWPWMATIRSVPVASFIVICLIWLSASNVSVFISFLIVVPIIYQNVLEGLRNTDVKMLEMANIFNVPWYKKWRYINLSAVKPYLLSACKVTIGMAWKAGVAAEIIGTPAKSIGKMLYTSKQYLDTDDLLCWTVIIVILSIAFEKLFMFVLGKCLDEK